MKVQGVDVGMESVFGRAYITEVVSVDSGLDEEGIICWEAVFEFHPLVLGLVVQLQRQA